MEAVLLSEIVEHVADTTGVTKADTSKVIKAALRTIEETLADGIDVQLTGFGKFSTRERPASTRNVFGKEHNIPAMTLVKFKPGKSLRVAVAGG